MKRVAAAPKATLVQSCVLARRVSRAALKRDRAAHTYTLLNEFLSSTLNPIEYVVGVDIVTETRCAPRLQLNEALGSSRGWLSSSCVIIFVSQSACGPPH